MLRNALTALTTRYCCFTGRASRRELLSYLLFLYGANCLLGLFCGVFFGLFLDMGDTVNMNALLGVLVMPTNGRLCPTTVLFFSVLKINDSPRR